MRIDQGVKDRAAINKWHGNRGGSVATFRCAEIIKLFQHRYRIQLPDDDAGRADAALMLAHLAFRTDPEVRMNHFLDIWCLWMLPPERALEKVFAMRSSIMPSADELAAKLNLRMGERTFLRITTIGAVDCDVNARKALRIEKQKVRQRQNRKKASRPSTSPLRISDRVLEIRSVLPKNGWRTVKNICEDLRNSGGFAELSSVKGAVHNALKHAEARGLLRIRREPAPRGLTVMYVARVS